MIIIVIEDVFFNVMSIKQYYKYKNQCINATVEKLKNITHKYISIIT